MTSRMKGDFHVRFCGRLGGKFPLPTRRFQVLLSYHLIYPRKGTFLLSFKKRVNQLTVLEYDVPKDSDAVKEVNKCVDYCRRALTVSVKYSYSGKTLTITPPSISPANNQGEYGWVFKVRL